MNFVAEVISEQDISEDKTRIGIIRYSTDAQLLISLNQFNSKETLVHAIFGIEFQTGITNANLAVQRARLEFLSNGRESANKVLIIVSDGPSSNPFATISQANLAKSEGVEIFSVGVGSSLNVIELNSVVSSPTSLHVINAMDFSLHAIISAAQVLSQGMCSGIYF